MSEPQMSQSPIEQLRKALEASRGKILHYLYDVPMNEQLLWCNSDGRNAIEEIDKALPLLDALEKELGELRSDVEDFRSGNPTRFKQFLERRDKKVAALEKRLEAAERMAEALKYLKTKCGAPSEASYEPYGGYQLAIKDYFKAVAYSDKALEAYRLAGGEKQ